MDIKVSFIVPVYNVEKYLKDCVDSLLAQTLEEIEIILVDDGSPDSCPAICDEYAQKDERIKVIHKKNGGLAAARNSGMKQASGEYIFFVDSDDAVVKRAAETAYNAAREMGVEVLRFNYFSCSESLKIQDKVLRRRPSGRILGHSDICRILDTMSTTSCMVFSWRNIYKRDFLEKKGIVFDEKLQFGEDSPFDMEVFLRAETSSSIDDYLYLYRHREGSIMRMKYKPDYDRMIELQWRKKLEQYEKFCREPSKAFYEDLAKYTLNCTIPNLVGNAFNSDDEKPAKIIRRIYDSEMLRRSLEDFDIEKTRSRSLDWQMLNARKHGHRFLFMLLAKYVYDKKK